MDGLFHVDGHGPKSEIRDEPDEKTQFEILKKLSWTQFVINFYDFHIFCR